MRKLLLLFIALLTGVSGAWADVLPASTWNISQALPTDSWVAMGENTPAGVTALGSYTAYYRTQEVTLETAGMIDINFQYSSGNHRLEILGVDALNGSSVVVASDYHFGYTGTGKSLNDYFLNGLSAGTYTLRYIINGNVSSSVGDITFRKFEADVVASLPKLTTDVNNPQYYSIGSYDRGGYLTSNGAGQGMTHVDFAAGSSWYFTAINGNNSGSVIGGVIAHCSDGTQMKQNWQTAASGQTIYILPNGVNTNGFSISKTFPISGSSSSCCDANNSNTGVGNWAPSSSDWRGTTWVFKTTVPIGPTGYYYFKGMATDRYPYLYSDFVGKSENSTYHHSPLSGKNGEVWKVTNSGTTFNLTNGEGLPLTIGSTAYETLTLSAASAGLDYYFTEAINLTNWGNDTKLTTWAGHPDATDNKWTFELVDVSAGVYNVVVQGNDAGYVTYSGQNAKNGGFFVAASIAVGDLTAHPIEGYTTSISISDRTITVSYNQQISYTLTDANGATYSWSASAPFGVAPTLSGCAGYSLSNEEWNEGTHSYSAEIAFPFAVSSNGIENYSFIGQFNNKNLYSASEFLWHANGTNIIIHRYDMPTTEDTDHDKFLWSIIPSFSDGAFTFTIKNKSTGTYVNSTCTENRHNVGDVTLSETATPMTYNSAGATGTCSPINAWYLPSTSKYLSANSVNNGVNDVLGVYGGVHDGISTGFPTYGDLISIYWSKNSIAAQIAKAGQYGYPVLSNDYTVALNGVKTAIDGGSYTGNKTNYNNLRTWFEGFLAADVVAPVAGDFLRIKASDINKTTGYGLGASNLYLTSSNCASKTDRVGFVEGATATDNTTIFYYDGNYLTGFANGLQPMHNSDNQMQIGTAGATATPIGFEAINSNEQHAFRVEFKNGGRSMYTQRGGSAGAYYYHTDAAGANQTDAHYRYFLEKVTSLPITLNAAGDENYYATLCLPCDVTIEGANAYTLSISGSWAVPTAVPGNQVPAGTPVLLKGTSATATASINTGESFGSAISNALTGVTQATTISGGNDYVLGKDNNGVVGFYHWNQNVLSGFRAYLTNATVHGSLVKGFAINWGGETGVESIEHSPLTIDHEAGAMFDLSGRRVNKAQKGLYIQNGKKVMVK